MTCKQVCGKVYLSLARQWTEDGPNSFRTAKFPGFSGFNIKCFLPYCFKECLIPLEPAGYKMVTVTVIWACTSCWLSIAHYNCIILQIMHTLSLIQILLLRRFEYHIEIVMCHWPIHILWWMMWIIKFATAQHSLLWEINQNIKQIRNKHYISRLRLRNGFYFLWHFRDLTVLPFLLFPQLIHWHKHRRIKLIINSTVSISKEKSTKVCVHRACNYVRWEEAGETLYFPPYY